MTERVIVAVGHFNGDGTWCEAVIVGWDKHGRLNLDISNLTASDILVTNDSDPEDTSDRVPKERGLWLWEGEPVVDGVSDGLPLDETGDCHLMKGGSWRRPTLEEIIVLGVI